MEAEQKPKGVIEDLKGAFTQDFKSGFKLSNDAPENSKDSQELRRANDFSGGISTRTMLKILIPLVILFVVGFLVYVNFFYEI